MSQHREGPDALWLAVGLAWLAFQLIVHTVTLAIVLLSYRRPWSTSSPAQGRSPSRPTTTTTCAIKLNPAEHPLHRLAGQLQSLSRAELQGLVCRPGRQRKAQLIAAIVCAC